MLLSERIEHFILDSLRHRYDGRSPVNVFLESQENGVRQIFNKNRTVEVQTGAQESFRAFVYRFPQTRMYYSIFQNAHWQIQILDIHDYSVFLIHKPDETQSLAFKTTDEKRYVLPVKNVGGSGTEPPKTVEIYWAFPKGALIPEQKEAVLLAFLQTRREQEYSRHIFNYFLLSDPEIQKNMDRWFAEIAHIDPNGNLRLTAIEAPELVWLHELYMQLGWWDELHEFYQQVKPDQFEKRPILKVLKQRLQNLRQVFSAEVESSNRTGFKSQAHSFLHRYLLGEENWEQLHDDLQSFWEYLQIPALRFRWQNAIAANADEFVAFALLAICRRFWWAHLAVDLVENYVPPSYRPLVKLLSTLMFHICFYEQHTTLKIGSFDEPDAERYLKTKIFNVRYYSFGKQRFSAMQSKGHLSVTVSIDQWVDVTLDFRKKELAIHPVLFRPPMGILHWRMVTIDYAGVNIQFPLVWEKVTLKINRCRLKFLRKKNRFQISVKNPDMQNQLKIDGHVVEMRPDRYARTYLSIEKGQSQMLVQAFTPTGGRIDGLPNGTHRLVLRGAALDVFGMLKQEFRVRISNSRRNHGLRCNTSGIDLLTVPRVPIDLVINAGKCSPCALHISSVDAFWHSFREVAAEKLVNELKIWLAKEDQAVIDIGKLQHRLYERLTWLPRVEWVSIEKFRPGKEIFNLLIASNARAEDEKIAQVGDITIYRSSNKPKMKYFQTDAQNWQNIFDKPFYLPKLKKI